MKTAKSTTFILLSVQGFIIVTTSCVDTNSPYLRGRQFCKCLDESLNSSDPVAGGLVYWQCKEYYNVSLRQLAPQDTTTFQNIADTREALFWVQVVGRGVDKVIEAQKASEAPQNPSY